MPKRSRPVVYAFAALAILAPALLPLASAANAPSTYDELVALFHDWRAFEAPPRVNGVPDYGVEAMTRQHAELQAYRNRLEAIDTTDWPVPQLIDWHLVRAEMNGLDFDHRVRRPWENNPAFYVMIFADRSDVPAHEGPVVHGWIDLWTYDDPLDSAAATELAGRIRAIPTLLQQARANLTGNAADLWRMGVGAMRGQSRDLAELATAVAGTSGELDGAIAAAIAATDEFAAWLEAGSPSKTGPSGVGRDNYTWYLQNVHLVPFSWDEQVTLMQRELWRSHASLRLEENRNRRLAPLSRIDSAEEYDRRMNEAVSEYMRFLEQEEFAPVRDYMDAALRARIGRFTPAAGLRGFFAEVDYRDPLVMRTHMHHWIELATMDNEPHDSPIRRVPSLYNIFDARSEGLATGMEEMSMHAGLFDDHPQARELVWIMLAQRAARALGGLRMHGDGWNLEQATEFAGNWTPRGWMPPDSGTAWGEQHLYLQQPGYGTSYVTGKILIEQLIAERARQLGDDFTLLRFMQEFTGAGVIPLSLVRWQMTGEAPWFVDPSTGR